MGRRVGFHPPSAIATPTSGSNGVDTVRFDADPIQTGRNGGTTLEGGGGITGKLTRNVSVYGDASYLTSVSGESRITLKGNVGMRVTW